MSDQSREYLVRVVWTGGKSGDVLVSNKPTIRTGSPPEFGGTKEFHSPEDLFVASASVCFMNSFVVFTEKMHIRFESFEVEAKGLLEKVGQSYEITHLHMKTKVVIESEDLRSKMVRALELGAKYCYVANSMKCPKEYENEITVR